MVTITISSVFVISVLTLGLVAFANLAAPVFAQQKQLPAAKGVVFGQSQNFTANLTGKNEVPPINTTAVGTAKFQLNREGNVLTYELSVTNITGVMGAHIHTGIKTENGAIVAGLYNPDNTLPVTGKVNGVLSKGAIKATDLRGPLVGKILGSLTDLMKKGEVYVNIHTQQNKNGEIRGQITPSSSG